MQFSKVFWGLLRNVTNAFSLSSSGGRGAVPGHPRHAARQGKGHSSWMASIKPFGRHICPSKQHLDGLNHFNDRYMENLLTATPDGSFKDKPFTPQKISIL